jgi:hypothetical protein
MSVTDGDAHETHTSLRQTGAGAYEFWALLTTFNIGYSGELRALDVDLGDGPTTTAVLWASPGSASGDWAQLIALDPSGTVVSVARSRWATEDAPPGVVPPSAAAELAEAAPTLFRRLDDTAWEDLLERAVEATDRINEEAAASVRDTPESSGRPPATRAPDPTAPDTLLPTTTTTVTGPP